MKELKQVNSLQELQNLRVQAKHKLEIEKLEFENSRLRMLQEMDTRRILPNLSEVLVSSLQKTILGKLMQFFK